MIEPKPGDKGYIPEAANRIVQASLKRWLSLSIELRADALMAVAAMAEAGGTNRSLPPMPPGVVRIMALVASTGLAILVHQDKDLSARIERDRKGIS